MSNSALKTVITQVAGEALAKYRFVVQDPHNAQRVVYPTADGMKCLGVTDDSQRINFPVAICLGGGTTWIQAHGSISRGDLLIAKETTGKADVYAGGSGQYEICAVALEDGSADDLVKVMIVHDSRHVA